MPPIVNDWARLVDRSMVLGTLPKITCGEVLQQVADRERGDQQRGRVGAADRPERDALDQRARRPRRSPSWRRSAPASPDGRGQHERVAADHDQLAVGEVDQAHDPEDERDPEREERVEAAEADGVDRRSGSAACITSRAPRYASRGRSAACELVASPGQGDLAGPQHVGAVGELERARGVLLDEQDRRCPRRAARASTSKTRSITSGARPSDGSSSSSSRGSREQRARDRELLLLAAREPCRRRFVVALEDRESLEHAPRVARGRARSLPTVAPSSRFSATRERVEDVASLGHERDARADDPLGRHAAEQLALEQRSSPETGAHQAERSRRQRRRLAGAVRTDERRRSRPASTVEATCLERGDARRSSTCRSSISSIAARSAAAEVGRRATARIASAPRSGVPDRDRLAVVEDLEPLAQPHDHAACRARSRSSAAAEVVADRAERASTSSSLSLLVEAGRRLVEQQVARTRRERARAMPSRRSSPVRRAPAPRWWPGRARSERVEQLERARRAARGGDARADGADLDVLEHREAGEQPDALKRAHEPGRRAALGRPAGHVGPADHATAPAGRRLEAA